MGLRAMSMLILLAATAATAGSCSSDGTGSPKPAVGGIERPTTWAEVDKSLDKVSSDGSMIAAEVADDGSFVVLHERNSDGSAAIGPAVSIYVLGMMTDRIASGDLSWKTPLTPDLTVSDAATSIIESGHGSVVDLLIDTVGRQRIEGLMPSMGLSEESQSRTLPLMTTSERTALTVAEDVLRTEYVTAGISDRRRILRSLADADSRSPGRASIDVSMIGWFASAHELARAQLWLDSQRGLPGQEPLEAVLAANSGVPLDPATWTRFSFVGGTAPGILSLSWLLQRSDGRRFVVAIIANDSQRLIADEAGTSIASGVIDLVAKS